MTLATVGRNEEALRTFRKVVTVDPDGAQVYFNLAVLLERMKRDGEALEVYRKFMDLSSNGELRANAKEPQQQSNAFNKKIGTVPIFMFLFALKSSSYRHFSLRILYPTLATVSIR